MGRLRSPRAALEAEDLERALERIDEPRVADALARVDGHLALAVVALVGGVDGAALRPDTCGHAPERSTAGRRPRSGGTGARLRRAGAAPAATLLPRSRNWRGAGC